ncbi:MAG: HAD family hydrolase [Lachnospiraceae bacterium]|nr:HAD family hydrolase [Lachnospiraceae bacterium]HCJ07291.1 HAD family hydrolase [Lachnospiraceae bacterium]
MEKLGIIFDMDGTLWDSAKAVAESWTEVVAREYTPERVITEDEIKRVMGLTMDKLAAQIFPELPEERRLQLLDVCGREENEYLRTHGAIVYPKVEETFQKLREKYHLYIVSNCQSGYIEAFLEYYGYDKYIEDIECYGNNGLVKGENIRKVVERNQLTKAVYVGDIQGDYDASMQAGVEFIHAAYGFGTVDADVPEIAAFEELPKVVESVL